MSFWMNRIVRLASRKLPIFYSQLYAAHTHKVGMTPTISISKGTIYYSPYFISSLSNDQLTAVIKHELCHAVLRVD